MCVPFINQQYFTPSSKLNKKNIEKVVYVPMYIWKLNSLEQLNLQICAHEMTIKYGEKTQLYVFDRQQSQQQ